ncbi:MAG: dihydroorotate dehydrogenase electron transfer subunit [Nitrososphaerales archaeon]
MEGLINKDRLRMVQIVKIENESKNVRTLYFYDRELSKRRAGQFCMVWKPMEDEMPMSVSKVDANGLASITVKPLGTGSKALYESKTGDFIGVRGPYGKPFELVKGSCLLVGGGTGLVPLIALAEELDAIKSKVTLIIAGRSKDELIFLDYVKDSLAPKGHRIMVSTDDGSYGFKGQAPNLVEILLRSERFDQIYTCGPEIMMHKIFLLAEKMEINLQAGLERIMKCGNGICGSCALGKYLVCKDGPIFSSKILREVHEEFGKKKRDLSGRFVEITSH